MNKIRVLLICGSDHKYGSMKAAMMMIKELYATGKVEFVVCTQDFGEVNQYCDRLGIKNIAAQYKYGVFHPCEAYVPNMIKRMILSVLTWRKNLRAQHRIEKFINLNTIDIIHTNLARDIIGIKLAEKYKKPHVVHLREFLDSHFSLEYIDSNQIKKFNKYTMRYVAVSDAVKRDWIGKGISSEKICTIYDGVLAAKIEKSRHHNNCIKIIMVGGLYEEKGQIQLIKAIQCMNLEYKRKIVVDIYGDGKKEYVDFLQKYINRNELNEYVNLKGYSENVLNKLKEYDIGITCSKAEGFGLCTVEYMYAGLCPIVSNTGANVEIVTNYRNGLVYTYNDIKDLSNKIIRLINDKNLIEELGKNASIDAERKFSIDNMKMKMLECYKDILNKG